MSYCPICKRRIPDDAPDVALPFCSQRCKLVDLHGWLSGRYVVSGPLSDDDALLGDEADDADRRAVDESEE